VKLLPGIVVCIAGFPFPVSGCKSAFPVILVRVVTSYFFESRRHMGGVATETWGSRLDASHPEPSPSYSSGSLPRFFFESRRHIGGVATWGSRLPRLARPIALNPGTSRKHRSHCSAGCRRAFGVDHRTVWSDEHVRWSKRVLSLVMLGSQQSPSHHAGDSVQHDANDANDAWSHRPDFRALHDLGKTPHGPSASVKRFTTPDPGRDTDGTLGKTFKISH
jgi:hypothetical protein